MDTTSNSNDTSDTARLTVDVPLSVYLELTAVTKGITTKSAYVTSALIHYRDCKYAGPAESTNPSAS